MSCDGWNREYLLSSSISVSFLAARRRSRMVRKMQASWISRRPTRGVVRLESRKGIVGRRKEYNRLEIKNQQMIKAR